MYKRQGVVHAGQVHHPAVEHDLLLRLQREGAWQQIRVAIELQHVAQQGRVHVGIQGVDLDRQDEDLAVLGRVRQDDRFGERGNAQDRDAGLLEFVRVLRAGCLANPILDGDELVLGHDVFLG